MCRRSAATASAAMVLGDGGGTDGELVTASGVGINGLLTSPGNDILGGGLSSASKGLSH